MKAWILQRLSNIFLGDYLGGIVRHAMTLVGGFLIAKGLATETAVTQAMPELVELVIGVITAAVGQGLSFANKKV
jgi:hypothetical protein